MANIVEFDGQNPKVDPTVFLAPSVWVIGRVKLEEGVNIWTGSVIRGDDETVVIGRRTTILEHCLIEAPMGMPVRIGSKALISHGAIIHGSHVGDLALVGIGAIVLEGARIGEGSIIGSGALIPPGTEVPPRKLVLGIPGRVIRDVRESEAEMMRREHERALTKAEKYRVIYRGMGLL